MATLTLRQQPPAPSHHSRTVRRGLLAVLGLVVLAGIVVASIAVGSHPVPLPTVWAALTHPDTRDTDQLLVTSLRIPRTVLGLLAGLALGMAGALSQSLTRNPLADPGLLGINSGAALAVAGSMAFLGMTQPLEYIWFAFGGAAAAAVVVYALGAARKQGATAARMALAGAAVVICIGAVTKILLLTFPEVFDQFRFWDVGSLQGRGYAVILPLAPFMVAGLLIALCLAKPLNSLALGEDSARALGVHVGATRLWVCVAVVLLAGSATAAAGPIAFVGLAVPHIVRGLFGPDHRVLLPATLLVSPIVLLGADVLGRVIAAPDELQTGIMTALVGAPVFLVLIRSKRMAQL